MAKTFDQYLSENGNQSTLDELRRTGQYDKASSQYNQTGNYGSVSSPSNGNFNDIVKSSMDQFKQAYQPAVDQLQSSIPTLQKGFDTQKQNLESQRGTLQQQYDNLISGLKTQQTQGVNAQTLATNNELGKRGILGSSGAAQQEIINSTEPINQNYANMIATTGNQGQQAQQQITQQQGQLTSDEANAIQNVQNAIAQYQSTGNANALQAAQSQYQSLQQQNQFNQNYALQQAQQSLADKNFNQITIPQSKSAIALNNAQMGLVGAQTTAAKQTAQMNNPAYLQQLFGSLGINLGGGSGATNTRPPLSSFAG